MNRIYTMLLACSFSCFTQMAGAQVQAPMGKVQNRYQQNKVYKEYLERAEYLYRKIWNLYRVPEFGMFSEYYPQQHQDTLTYMQEQQVQSKKVSFLWPFSGLFSATNILLQVPGRQGKYLHYLDSVVMTVEQYRDTLRKPVGYQAYPPRFEKSDRYYDDNGLVVLDYTWAYRNTHNPLYLHRADETFRFILSGWSGQLGGGVTWLEGHSDQKPACSNGMATLSALKLYEATKDARYLRWGLKFYDWMVSNLRDSSGLYSNDRKTANGEVNHTYWTYNSGSMIEAAVMLYRFTGKKAYLKEAQRIAEASFRHFAKKGKDGSLYILDLPWFVLVLFRGYEALYLEDHNPKYIAIIKQNTDKAWQHARDRFGLIYKDWNSNTNETATAKWLLDEACMVEFYARFALLALHSKPGIFDKP